MKLKTTAHLYDIEHYPIRFQLRAVYSDMDAFRHVNNGAIGRYFEEGRADLNMRVFGIDSMINPPNGLQLLFASLTIDFLGQIHYPGTVEVATGIGRFGNSSYYVQQALFQNDICCALAEASLVKARHGVPESLTALEREKLTAYLSRSATE